MSLMQKHVCDLFSLWSCFSRPHVVLPGFAILVIFYPSKAMIGLLGFMLMFSIQAS